MSITQYPVASGGGGDIDEIYELGAIAAIQQDSASLTNIVASPEAMNVVAGSDKAHYAIGVSGQLWDAITASEMATAKLFTGRVGLNPSDFADGTDVAANLSAVNAILADSGLKNFVLGSDLWMAKMLCGLGEFDASSIDSMDDLAASNSALTAVFNSWTARELLWDSESASDVIMDTSNSNTWMRNNVTATTSITTTQSYTLKVDKKVFVLQAQSTATGSYASRYGGGYRYIQPGDGTYFNNARHNVATTDRVQPLQLRTEVTIASNTEIVTYVQMEQ